MPTYSRHVGQGKHFQSFLPSSPLPWFFPNLSLSRSPCEPGALTQRHLKLYHARACAFTTTALKFLSPSADPPVPWQRVVSSAGKISSRGPGTDGAQRQREALEAEDVEVRVGGGAGADEFLIDLAAYGWFPAQVSWNGAGDPVED